jgi:hypothetical protein
MNPTPATKSYLGFLAGAMPSNNGAPKLVTAADCSRGDRLHVPQWRYVGPGGSRFNAVACSKRAGKSRGAVRKAARILLEKPGARVCYITLIRRNARKYFFAPLFDLLSDKRVAVNPNASDLTMELGNGSFAQCFGCSDSSEVQTVFGDQWDLAIIDEAQSFRDEVIEELVERALMPALRDRHGGLDLLGTPAPCGPAGYFYGVYAGKGFERHHWTIFENPWIETDAELDALLIDRGITPEHAVYKREYLGEFVVDPDSLVFEYLAGRNDLEDGFRPDPDDEKTWKEWRCSMGVDLGFSDRDAINVMAWKPTDEKHRLVEGWTWQKNHLDIDELAKVFVAAVERWRPVRIVGDTGGHGAVKCIKSLEARMGHAVLIEAKPSSVVDSIALMNDDLRTGRMLWDPRGILVADAKLETWEPGQKKVKVSSAFHSDALPACRYAHSCAYHWTGKAPPKKEESYGEYLERNIRERQRRRQAGPRGMWGANVR